MKNMTYEIHKSNPPQPNHELSKYIQSKHDYTIRSEWQIEAFDFWNWEKQHQTDRTNTPIDEQNRTWRWKICQSELWTTTREPTTAAPECARTIDSFANRRHTYAHVVVPLRVLQLATLRLHVPLCKADQFTSGMRLNPSTLPEFLLRSSDVSVDAWSILTSSKQNNLFEQQLRQHE